MQELCAPRHRLRARGRSARMAPAPKNPSKAHGRLWQSIKRASKNGAVKNATMCCGITQPMHTEVYRWYQKC